MFNLPPVVAHLVELGALSGVSAIACGVGLMMLRLLGVAGLLSIGERLVFGMALGYGVLGFAMLGMGVLGLVYLPVALAVLAALAVMAYGPLRDAWRDLRPALGKARRGLRYRPNIFLAIISVAVVLAALAKTLVPVATQDDLMYHLALPKRYIEQHAVAFYPDSTYSLFPQLMEMLYTWGLLLGSDRLSVLFAFAMGLLGAVAAGLFAKRHLGGDGAGLWHALPLLTATLYLSTPLTGFILRAANTDLAQATFDLLAVYAFWLGVGGEVRGTRGEELGIRGQGPGIREHLRESLVTRHWSRAPRPSPLEPRLLGLAGVCCGLSFSVKYYGFAMAMALGVALVGVYLFRRRRGAADTPLYMAIAWFALPVALLAGPWLLRNYVSSGNPVWPLAGALLGGSYWSPQASPETLLGRAPGIGLDNVWTGLQYLWTATTRPWLLVDRQIHVVSLGPLLLPALLLLPFARWRAALRWVAYAAATYWLLWAFFFSRTSIRYLSTFFLLAAVLGAYALVSLATRHRAMRYAGAVVVLMLAVMSTEATAGAGRFLPTVFALDKAAESRYLATYMEDYNMMRYISANLPPDARVYVWDGQPRGYYIARPYVYARLVPLYTGFASEPEEWRERLRQLGITHILLNRVSSAGEVLAPGQPPGYDPNWQVSQDFARRYFGRNLTVVGEYALYELKEGP
ncbi:MAG TPA: hypothetical protein VEW94_12815 [Chloroflexia bacterium]|nr:hypothetical protein [Chloroflexia bacterium]